MKSSRIIESAYLKNSGGLNIFSFAQMKISGLRNSDGAVVAEVQSDFTASG